MTASFVVQLDARSSLVVAHPAIRIPRRLLIIVYSSVDWFACVHATLALLVVSRRTRVSREISDGGMYVSRWRQCQFPGVLVLSTEIVAVDLVYYT